MPKIHLIYAVGDWVKIQPATVALGYESRGVIDRVSPSETKQYGVLFSDGSISFLHFNQIVGKE